MFDNQDIKPVRIDDRLFPYMEQCNKDFEKDKFNISSDDVKNWICSFFSKKPKPERIVFDRDEYRRELIRQLSARDRKTVLKQWADCGIDRATAEYYMNYFALKDSEGRKFDLIIPADPATVFLWYWYEIYCWEEIGSHFGIYIYVFVYGFFFPYLIFEIPSPNEINDEQLKSLYDNYKIFEREMTMRRTVELILLYKNEKNMNSRFFEPDIPTRPIECNPEWRKKLSEYVNK